MTTTTSRPPAVRPPTRALALKGMKEREAARRRTIREEVASLRREAKAAAPLARALAGGVGDEVLGRVVTELHDGPGPPGLEDLKTWRDTVAPAPLRLSLGGAAPPYPYRWTWRWGFGSAEAVSAALGPERLALLARSGDSGAATAGAGFGVGLIPPRDGHLHLHAVVAIAAKARVVIANQVRSRSTGWVGVILDRYTPSGRYAGVAADVRVPLWSVERGWPFGVGDTIVDNPASPLDVYLRVTAKSAYVAWVACGASAVSQGGLPGPRSSVHAWAGMTMDVPTISWTWL